MTERGSIRQLTEKESMSFFDNNLWENMSTKERAQFQIIQDRLCMPMGVFIDSVVKTLNRSITPFELFMNRDSIITELFDDGKLLSFEELIKMIPYEKLTLVLS